MTLFKLETKPGETWFTRDQNYNNDYSRVSPLPIVDRHEECCALTCCSFSIQTRRLRRHCSFPLRPNSVKMRFLRLILALCVLLLVGLLYMLHYDRESYNYLVYFIQSTDNTTSVRSQSPTDSLRTQEVKKVVNPQPLNQGRRKSSLGNPFNPDTFDNSTVDPSKRYLILYWSMIRGHKARIQRKEEYEKDPHVWPFTYVGENCPVPCELTNDRTRANEASAFVVHSRSSDVWDFPPFEFLAPWILQNNENPVYTAALSDSRVMGKFNLLISYRLDSDFPSPIYPKPSLSPPIPFKQRLGNILAVFSKCEPVRTEYMRQLMMYIDVHSYGACLKNRQGLIGLYGQANGKYVFKDYKMVLSRYYKFSLVFMNQDCDYFVDDRLYHAFETGSVPIYMGTDKVDEFLPPNLRKAIIKVSDFRSPKELAEYLHYLSSNETLYNEYLAWKRLGLGDYSNSTLGRWWNPRYPLFCQVCMRLSQGRLHPGLSTDTCNGRTFEDWGLEPPVQTMNETMKVISAGIVKYPVAFIGLIVGAVILGVNGLKHGIVIVKALKWLL